MMMYITRTQTFHASNFQERVPVLLLHGRRAPLHLCDEVHLLALARCDVRERGDALVLSQRRHHLSRGCGVDVPLEGLQSC